MYRPPLDILEHQCELPDSNVVGLYFECDECGKDYVIVESEFRVLSWKRVRWYNRKRIRRSVGIDETCHLCGYRAFRNVQRTRPHGNIQHFCAYHEEQVRNMPTPNMWEEAE